MIFVVLSVAILIIGVAAVGYKNSQDKEGGNKTIRANLLVPVVLAGAVFFGSMIAIVPANSIGVVYSPFVGVKDETLPEGFHVKGPFDEIYNISTEIQTGNLTNVTGQTKDSQFVTMEIDVKYCVSSENGVDVFRRYRTLANVSSNIIKPTVQRSIEAVTTKYNIIEILGEKRNEMYAAIEDELTARFADNGIQFVSINFVDTDAGEAIENAIKAEAVAKKAVETAEQERLKAEIEAQTAIIKAQAEADANRILSESLTPELLAKMEAEARLKWGWITVQGGSIITDARD